LPAVPSLSGGCPVRALLQGCATWAAGLLLLGACQPCRADADGAALALERVQARFQGTESSASGQVLNRDQGPLAGWRGAWVAAQRGWWLSASRLEGEPDYRGRTQIGLPLATATRQLQHDWRVGGPLGQASVAGGQLQWALEGARRRQWRDIQPTPLSTRLTERLQWWQLGLQGKASWPLEWLPDVEAWGQGAWSRGWCEQLRADFHLAGEPAVTVRPAATMARSLSWGARWAPAPAWSLELAWHDERLHHASSPAQPYWRNGQVVGSVTYPGSRQRLSGYTLGVVYLGF